MNPGIDYGRGVTNADPENGIRFGTIIHHHVFYWNDESKPDFEGTE